MVKIKNIQALEILDSRGNPTIRTFLTLEDNSMHSASVPSGASTGQNEAVELRDGDKSRYNGKGVLKAIENVNTVIRDTIVGKEVDPKTIDRILIELDGTENKSKLGANAILSVSLAVARAAAHSSSKPLWQFLNGYFFRQQLGASSQKPAFPRLMVNVVNGGKHANWNFDIQEFMIVPNATTPSESIRVASEIFHSLGSLLKAKGLSTLVGDEGGYSPALKSNEKVFEVILEAAKNAGYENVKDFRLSIDAAASEFFKDNKYTFQKSNEILSADELMKRYSILNTQYSIFSIEDGFDQNDWTAWSKFTKQAEVGVASGGGPPASARNELASEDVGRGRSDDRTPTYLIIIGDDLFCTNPQLIQKGIDEKAANAVLIKLNQIGTVTETAEAIKLGQNAGWKIAVSHRSGETEDSFIADLAYACGADFLKSGSMSRSERLSKYNRLLEIEKGL